MQGTGSSLHDARVAELPCDTSCLQPEPLPTMIDVSSAGVPADVLVVEDDPIIALDFEDTVLRFGVKTVRTAGSVSRALQCIEERAPDFVLLDIGLVREKSFAVAERLEALGIPFAFVTGYGADAATAAAFAHAPRLPKPCLADALKAALGNAAARR
jgi:CheY-like chemotaxis protein